jgi:adenine-specific DNA-methyltransferase
MLAAMGRWGASQMSLGFVEPDLEVDLDAENGEVFTRQWVVDLILDLSGYTANQDLASAQVVEPACGAGAFLVPTVDRLLASCKSLGKDATEAADAIRAFDLLQDNVERSRQLVVSRLVANGIESATARRLSKSWVRQGDFLLTDHGVDEADFVIGNPPYIRLENLSVERNAAYRQACPTMRGRSDIFVGFIELGLRILRPGGVLGFIVADRWMRNQYGASLREFVAEEFSVEAVIEMHDVEAFEEAVSAYPAITLIRRSKQEKVLVASTTKEFGAGAAEDLRNWAVEPPNGALRNTSINAAWLPQWFSGQESWPWGGPEQLALIADLEARLPPLQDPSTGTRVGIGLATGADNVYLTNDPDLVEPERLLPFVMAGDLTEGDIRWSGTYLVNPWNDDGLVDLGDWPRFRSYLERHGDQVRARHTARKTPDRWHKTIDRVTPGLLERPKLLLPEMKAAAHPVLDEGKYYPHHNLYHITSSEWDLEVLGGLMLSDLTNLFVGAYCVKMRGGCYRFQAQYLRRVRVPQLESIREADRKALARAFQNRDVEAATATAMKLCGISELPRSTDP